MSRRAKHDNWQEDAWFSQLAVGGGAVRWVRRHVDVTPARALAWVWGRCTVVQHAVTTALVVEGNQLWAGREHEHVRFELVPGGRVWTRRALKEGHVDLEAELGDGEETIWVRLADEVYVRRVAPCLKAGGTGRRDRVCGARLLSRLRARPAMPCS